MPRTRGKDDLFMETKVKTMLDSLSNIWTNSSGQKMMVINLDNVRLIASETGVTPKDVEISCLQRQIIPLRYTRNIGTTGIDGQLKLLRSTVAVCGTGGLGGTLCELLARQGIGHLIIIDQGKFEENNLNRQIMTTEEDIGKPKVEVTANRIGKINSAITLTLIHESIDAINVKIFIGKADVVIDALDNFTTRRVVADACCDLNIPFIHGAIAGFHGQVMTIFPGDKGIDAICGSRATADENGLEIFTGNPSATPSVIAAWQAQEAVKIITGIGSPIRHRLLMIDFENGTVDEVQLSHFPGAN